MKVEHNISRIKYLLKIYGISVQDFLASINKGLKKPIEEHDIFSNDIHINHLKRIDNFFNKGLHYYLDPKSPDISHDASIFFRKDRFNADLNLQARKVVNKFEEFKISLSAIAKLSEINLNRKLDIYTTNDNPEDVADSIRNLLYPNFNNDLKTFLKSLINKFSDYNILVFEFVEYWNQKNTANLDGFFLAPNVIVLKRQQRSFRREIFTLAHELGHFLLNEEEIDSLDLESLSKVNLPIIEQWCNNFAFYFLAGKHASEIDNISYANVDNDYHYDLIEEVSKKTHLSKLALFTRLLYRNKISQEDYNTIKKEFEDSFQEKLKVEEFHKEIDNEKGVIKRGSSPKPIESPLFVSTIITAFNEGIINEQDVCKKLNIKPGKLDRYIQ